LCCVDGQPTGRVWMVSKAHVYCGKHGAELFPESVTPQPPALGRAKKNVKTAKPQEPVLLGFFHSVTRRPCPPLHPASGAARVQYARSRHSCVAKALHCPFPSPLTLRVGCPPARRESFIRKTTMAWNRNVQWSRRERKLRLCYGVTTHDGCSTRLSIGLRPLLFRWRRHGPREWSLVLCDVALHYRQSYHIKFV